MIKKAIFKAPRFIVLICCLFLVLHTIRHENSFKGALDKSQNVLPSKIMSIKEIWNWKRVFFCFTIVLHRGCAHYLGDHALRMIYCISENSTLSTPVDLSSTDSLHAYSTALDFNVLQKRRFTALDNSITPFCYFYAEITCSYSGLNYKKYSKLRFYAA